MRKGKCRPRWIIGSPSAFHHNFQGLLRFLRFREPRQKDRPASWARNVRRAICIPPQLRFPQSPNVASLLTFLCRSAETATDSLDAGMSSPAFIDEKLLWS